MATIGEQIIAARKAKGMTQDELAQAMSVSRPTISHWERNHSMPDAEALLRLSQVLDYSFENATENQGDAAVPPAPSDYGVEDGGAASPSASAPAEAVGGDAQTSRPQPKKPAKGRWILAVSVAAALLCAALVIALPMLKCQSETVPAVSEEVDTSRLSKAFFQQANPEEDGKAYLTLTSTLETKKMNDTEVWMYTLTAHEQHGFAFPFGEGAPEGGG